MITVLQNITDKITITDKCITKFKVIEYKWFLREKNFQ